MDLEIWISQIYKLNEKSSWRTILYDLLSNDSSIEKYEKLLKIRQYNEAIQLCQLTIKQEINLTKEKLKNSGKNDEADQINIDTISTPRAILWKKLLNIILVYNNNKLDTNKKYEEVILLCDSIIKEEINLTKEKLKNSGKYDGDDQISIDTISTPRAMLWKSILENFVEIYNMA